MKDKRSKIKRPRSHSRFAGVGEEDETACFVIGLPATVFRDDDTAEFIENWGHLLGDPENRMDRYDARLLLDPIDLKVLDEEVEPVPLTEEEQEVGDPMHSVSPCAHLPLSTNTMPLSWPAAEQGALCRPGLLPGVAIAEPPRWPPMQHRGDS